MSNRLLRRLLGAVGRDPGEQEPSIEWLRGNGDCHDLGTGHRQPSFQCLKWLTGSITNGVLHFGFAAGKSIGPALRVNEAGAAVSATTGGWGGDDGCSTGLAAVVAVAGVLGTSVAPCAMLTGAGAGVE